MIFETDESLRVGISAITPDDNKATGHFAFPAAYGDGSSRPSEVILLNGNPAPRSYVQGSRFSADSIGNVRLNARDDIALSFQIEPGVFVNGKQVRSTGSLLDVNNNGDLLLWMKSNYSSAGKVQVNDVIIGEFGNHFIYRNPHEDLHSSVPAFPDRGQLSDFKLPVMNNNAQVAFAARFQFATSNIAPPWVIVVATKGDVLPRECAIDSSTFATVPLDRKRTKLVS